MERKELTGYPSADKPCFIITAGYYLTLKKRCNINAFRLSNPLHYAIYYAKLPRKSRI